MTAHRHNPLLAEILLVSGMFFTIVRPRDDKRVDNQQSGFMRENAHLKLPEEAG
jgi:hypothetical protein